MISVPGKSGWLLFALSRNGLGWRWGDTWYLFKPPWNGPLFSERHGHCNVLWRFKGWRVIAK